MPDFASVLRRALAAMAGSLMIVGATASVASASYGEIQHFGAKGVNEGQFEGSEESTAIGVDPRDNSVYVVDLPGEKAAEKNEFRIQKFKANGEGKYEAVASVHFKPADDELSEEVTDTVEGVAVDPAMNRIYVLAAEERSSNKVGEVDPEVTAATQLLAFSTVESGKTLVPAEGTPTTGKEIAVLAGEKVLKPLSKTPGESLLEPSGIAVDPTNHNIIILGNVDNGKTEFPQIALQRITATGEKGARWVDTSEYFEDETSSPVVTASGEVLVDGNDEFSELAKVPSNFSSTEAPVPFGQTQWNGELEHLTVFPGSPDPESGGALAIGQEGTIYTRASIADQFAAEPFRYPGIVEFNEKGQELGWTGGQSIATVGEGGPCKIGFSAVPQIAAGKENKVFVYNVNRQLAVPVDQILEFGPGGTGCPAGKATAPVATVNGQKVPEGESIPISDKVVLSSTLTEANATEVEWEFGDGSKETLSTRQYEKTEVTHVFKTTGTLTVKEKIHTDDLAAPLLEVETHVNITGHGPTVVTGAAHGVGANGATLTGTVNANGTAISKCTFEYGPASEHEKFPLKEACTGTIGSGTSPVEVTAVLAGLASHTAYHFRISAENASGETGTGAEAQFTTGPAPVAVTGASSTPTQTSVSLAGTVNPEGAPVESCYFAYGPKSTSEKRIPCASLPPSGSSPVAVTAALSGLTPHTLYHWQLVATGSGGQIGAGAEATFTTAAEVVVTLPPTETIPTNTTPNQSVLPSKTELLQPLAKLAGSPTTVSSNGAFTVTVSCAAGSQTCTGTVTLKTAKAVVASVGHIAKSKAAVLTLATGSFSISAGQSKKLTLHLSAKARALLAKAHLISAKATFQSHGPTGLSSTTTVGLTLRPAKRKR
jgi:hypothetical protein